MTLAAVWNVRVAVCVDPNWRVARASKSNHRSLRPSQAAEAVVSLLLVVVGRSGGSEAIQTAVRIRGGLVQHSIGRTQITALGSVAFKGNFFRVVDNQDVTLDLSRIQLKPKLLL